MALVNIDTFSFNFPMPVLQLVQSNWRTFPLEWSWSTHMSRFFPNMFWQMAHLLSCENLISSICSGVMP